MEIQYRNVSDLQAYENNPRKNDKAVEAVAESIRNFGFRVPLVIDKDDVIVCGHTRAKAAESIGMKVVPCVIADDLSEEKIKAFRLADNKTAELAEWDISLLAQELDDLATFDMSEFGFDLDAIAEQLIPELESEEETLERQKKEFEERMAAGELSEDDEEYQQFLEKFEKKKTTDDCYTPDNIYEVVADWVAKEYKIKRTNFVRPFYPGGDYKKEKYKGKIVVDNPPFSILTEIEDWYNDHGVKYFLFCPGVSAFPGAYRCTAVCCSVSITYENGAAIVTSFVTNMEDPQIVARTAPDLYALVDQVNRENTVKGNIPNYEYPKYLVTASMMSYLAKYGQNFKFTRDQASKKIGELDSQKKEGKGIYGGGYLLSEKAAAEKAATRVWPLSERELQIIKELK